MRFFLEQYRLELEEKQEEASTLAKNFLTQKESEEIIQYLYPTRTKKTILKDSEIILFLLHDLENLQERLDNPKLSEVQTLFSHLSIYGNYLCHKEIADWDDYDYSNFHNQLVKAGLAIRAHGLFEVYSKTGVLRIIRWFDHLSTAQEKRNELIQEQEFTEEQLKIYQELRALS
jgi:hypothetical protein